jgi:hypothetical protein
MIALDSSNFLRQVGNAAVMRAGKVVSRFAQRLGQLCRAALRRQGVRFHLQGRVGIGLVRSNQ